MGVFPMPIVPLSGEDEERFPRYEKTKHPIIDWAIPGAK